MKSFLKHYLKHCRIKKYRRIQYHALLAKWNASFGKEYQRPSMVFQWNLHRVYLNCSHMTLTLGRRARWWIHGAFLLRLSVYVTHLHCNVTYPLCKAELYLSCSSVPSQNRNIALPCTMGKWHSSANESNIHRIYVSLHYKWKIILLSTFGNSCRQLI